MFIAIPEQPILPLQIAALPVMATFPLLFQSFWALIEGLRLSGAPPGDLQGGERNYFDPRFKRILWYLIASTRGGINRARILEMLSSNPANANQIATGLEIDYKTVIHHLKVLSENGLVITDAKDAYGATYFLTPLMEKNYRSFKEILERIKDR
jgi:DNA-binding transcriptional ArsR family regulator